MTLLELGENCKDLPAAPPGRVAGLLYLVPKPVEADHGYAKTMGEVSTENPIAFPAGENATDLK
jgi:hypothetical protein